MRMPDLLHSGWFGNYREHPEVDRDSPDQSHGSQEGWIHTQINILKQWHCTIALSSRTKKMINSPFVQSSVVAVNHRWLLSRWNMASAFEELDFYHIGQYRKRSPLGDIWASVSSTSVCEADPKIMLFFEDEGMLVTEMGIWKKKGDFSIQEFFSLMVHWKKTKAI